MAATAVAMINPGNKDMTSNYPWLKGVGVHAPAPSWGVRLLRRPRHRPTRGRAGGCCCCWLVLKSSHRKPLEWLEPERLCNRQPNTKKHTGLYRCLITLLFLKMFFLSLLKGSNLTVPGSWAGVARGSSLGPRCLWGHGAKHQSPFTSPSALGTFSLFFLLLLPTESFPKPSPGSKKSLPQGMEPWPRDTPQLKPKSQSTFAEGIYCTTQSIARAPARQRGHQPQTCCSMARTRF